MLDSYCIHCIVLISIRQAASNQPEEEVKKLLTFSNFEPHTHTHIHVRILVVFLKLAKLGMFSSETAVRDLKLWYDSKFQSWFRARPKDEDFYQSCIYWGIDAIHVLLICWE